MRTPVLGALCALLLLAPGCAPATKADIEQAQSIIDLGDAVNDLRMQTSELQQQIDSLRTVAVKQDSVIRQLANLAGVPVPP